MSFPSTSTFLAIGGLIMVAVVLLLLFFAPVPEGNAAPMNIVLGAVLGWVGSAYAFFYGSTKTAQLKDDTINTLASGTGTGVAAPLPGNTTTTTSTTAPTPEVKP